MSDDSYSALLFTLNSARSHSLALDSRALGFSLACIGRSVKAPYLQKQAQLYMCARLLDFL